jgi:hypothetical protein
MNFTSLFFILGSYVRKGDKIFAIKVNKMTSKTSLTEFNLVAKKIAETL